MAVRVLVVDDDEVSREVLAVLLEGEGYAVEAVDSGAAAVLYLRMVRPLPGVVLTDMQMPGVSGDALAREMREICGAEAALLAMSGSELEAGAGREFDGFLLKPFSMAELAGAIAGGVARAARGTELAGAIAGGVARAARGAELAGAIAGGVARAARGTEGVGARVLDEAVYAKVAAAMRREKVEELYALCLKDAEGRMAKMRRAAEDGEDGVYRREAHALQGGCGMVGAREMQSLARALEEQGVRGDYVASLDELVLAMERLRRMLVAHAGNEERATGVSGENAR